MYREILNVAVEAATRAGEVLKKGFGEIKSYELKGTFDPVTEYDKKSEEIIKDFILSKFPNSSILGEESGIRGIGDIRWIVDPLDGTVNFIHGLPFIAVSIGVEIDEEIVIGVINNPILGEIYTACKGGGSYKNNSRIFVSRISDPSKSLVVTGFPYIRKGRVEELINPLRTFICEYQGFRRLGSAALDLAYVAAGTFEAFYEENLKPWDTAAGKIIVEESGGRLSNYRGETYSIYSNNILATNGLIHEKIIEVLRDVNI